MATGTIPKTGWTFLWENSAPTSSFAAQTVSLDLSSYSAVYIEFGFSTGDTRYYSVIQLVGSNVRVMRQMGNSGGTMFFRERTVQATTSGVIFGSGTTRTQGSSTITSSDDQLMPMLIYGIK